MVGIIIMMINGYYEAFNGEGFIMNIGMLGAATMAEILIEAFIAMFVYMVKNF